MDAGQAEQEVRVQAAVGIRQIPGSLKQDSFLVVNKDSNRLIFISKADKGVQEGCFTIDGVFSLDTGQDKLFLEQLQPLLDMVPLGYSVSLLVCEAHHDGTQTQIQAFVQKVIESVLQETSPAKNSTQYLQTITFVQIYTDGKAQDLLSPRSQVLQVMDLPPLGLMVEEATEVVVANSQAATHCYLQGMSLHQSYLQKSFQEQHKAAICGNLFTITMETKAEGGQGLQRAAVKIFEFSGGNEQHPADPFLPLFRASSAAALPADTGFLCWMLKHLLEENALTFLLLCLTLPDASGEEIRSAISLTEQVRTVTKKVAPVHWDPTHEAQKRREVIGELRAQLSFRSRMEQESMLSQLERVIKEIQVLKSQRWKKKKEASAYEAKATSPEVRGKITLDTDDGGELGNQQSQDDTQQEKETSGLKTIQGWNYSVPIWR
ncbi:kinesin KIF17 [Podarcis lilfordi]|uniref:Kinesin KIF17 n=1 Tax=Podarcis lilfordi TaxID=74358 RepID=A0AA35PC31_9SAUR|nr:kinesin KIF17 [Podarcis lilfordi]